MSEAEKPNHKPQLIPANFSDEDAAMSRKILIGFLVIAGTLLVLLAIPGIKSLLGAA